MPSDIDDVCLLFTRETETANSRILEKMEITGVEWGAVNALLVDNPKTELTDVYGSRETN